MCQTLSKALEISRNIALVSTLRREIVYETNLNLREKSTGSQFVKLNPREKKVFVSFSRISKTYIFTLGSLPINDGHVKNILQDIKQYMKRQNRRKNLIFFFFICLLFLISSEALNRELSLLHPNNAIWNIEKLGMSSVTHILLAEEQTTIICQYENIKIYKTLIKLRYSKINPREKSTGSQFAKLNPREIW